MRFDWDWGFAFSILPDLVGALWVTILATILGMSLALVGGLLLALLRRSRVRLVSWPAALFIEFIRSTPLLVQIFFVFYAFPELFGLRLSPLATGVIALGIHYSSYTSEVYRAGIEAVGRGQWEAATALNFSTYHTWTRIVLPQSIPPVVPALGNYLVAMFKDTPLLSSITVLELLNVAKNIGSDTFRYTEPITLVGVLFLVISLVAAQGVRRIEKMTRLPR
jgi:polar amino acid transport system permease protein